MFSVAKKGPEIVIGLVGALGADLTAVSEALRRALATVDYEAIEINLLDLVAPLGPWKLKPETRADRAMAARMDCGNRCRATLERADALGDVRDREDPGPSPPPIWRHQQASPPHAFLLRSLKTPEEIDLLRQVYGESCYIVSAYAPHEQRRQHLVRTIAASYHADKASYASEAEALIARDRLERGERYGQNVGDTFWKADMFLDATTLPEIEKTAARFVEIVFQHPFRTPTREEFGMFQAHGAALRSAQAGRQVGACIAHDGEVVSIGTNEVPKAFGGQYWEHDAPDGRDHRTHGDSTQQMTRDLFADVIARLRSKGWLADSKATLALTQLIDTAEREQLLARMVAGSDDPPSLTGRAPILSIIEFMRAVHAEMAALVSAARHGASVAGCSLFATAFPCHECARHIVAAGIREVYFIEPYPKSKVADLYDDSIVVDGQDPTRVAFRAFTGIAPRLYPSVFASPPRKSGGAWVRWDEIKTTQVPRSAAPFVAYREIEAQQLIELSETLHVKCGAPFQKEI
jgi:deoxycytidylate deaminase